MHRLKEMKDTLVSCVQAQLGNLHEADTHELGEAIDMIKDLEQAMYYCSIVKAMEEQKEEREKMEEYYKIINLHRDMDRDEGRMYYTPYPDKYMPNKSGAYNPSEHIRGIDRDREISGKEPYFPYDNEMPRDSREGKSPISRRHYMESKQLHKDKASKVKELEKYMQELSEDIIEMIEDASPEERQMLEKKMTHLTSKIAQLNV